MLDDLEAVRAVCDILRPFQPEERSRIGRWVSERLEGVPPTPPAEPVVTEGPPGYQDQDAGDDAGDDDEVSADAPASESAEPPAEVEQQSPKNTPSAAAPPAPAQTPPKKPTRTPSGRRRYSPEVKAAVLADVRAGMSAYAAAEKHDVSTGAAYRWANQAGLVNKDKPPVNKSKPPVNRPPAKDTRRSAIAEAAKRTARPPTRLRRQPPADPKTRREQILQAIATQVPPKHVMETYGLSRDDYDRIRDQWLRDHQ